MPRARRGGSALAVAALVLSLAACTEAPTAPSGFAPSVVVHDRVIPFDRLQRWTLASVPSWDSTRLTVFAVGTDTGGGPCGPPVIRLAAIESATTVRVSVADYKKRAGPTVACPGVGYVGTPQTVVLDEPIGDRRIVDASTGETQRLLIATDYPRLVAPSGFTMLPFGQVAGPSEATQAWRDRGEVSMWLETATPNPGTDDAPEGFLVDRVSINGSPARVFTSGGEYQQWRVRWTPNSRQTITLRMNESPQRRWKVDEVETLARKVTNYRTDAASNASNPSTSGRSDPS